MNPPQQNLNHSVDEINLLDYVNILVEHRRMILRNTLLVALFVSVFSFFLPKYYSATTTLLPPDEAEPSGLKGLLSNAPISVLNLPGVPASSSEIFVEILKSRSVGEGVLKRKYAFEGEKKDLYQIWDIDSKARALKKLSENTRISSNEQSIIEIAVEMKNPQLAAEVANAFTAELDRVNKEKSFSKAKNSRIYIEEQLQKTELQLKQASQTLAEFQSKYKAVDLEEQTRIAIEKAGEIKGTIMAKEVELQVTLQTMKRDNPIIERLQKELDELKKQFEHLQFGNSVLSEDQKDYFIPFADVPAVGLRLAELIREVKVQETVWQLLNQQYYSAKIQEARDTPTVQVLDKAVPPEKRSKPKRKMLVMVSSLLAMMFSVFWAFVLEFGEKVKQNPEDFQKLKHIVQEIRQDFETMKKFFSRLFQKVKKN